jgi:uncharacterized protein (TIGR03000 family)
MRRFLTAASLVMPLLMGATANSFAQPVPYRDPYGPPKSGYGPPRRGLGPANVSPNVLGEPSEPEANPDEFFLEALHPYLSRYYTIVPSHPDAVMIDVQVPVGAQLWFQGQKTRQSGAIRFFESPPLQQGKIYVYKIEAAWQNEKGEKVERTRMIQVHAGQFVRLDLR